jgi:Concanavalin A-like lectin/glucanases superfamily/Ig-like domain CHU_C associated
MKTKVQLFFMLMVLLPMIAQAQLSYTNPQGTVITISSPERTVGGSTFPTWIYYGYPVQAAPHHAYADSAAAHNVGRATYRDKPLSSYSVAKAGKPFTFTVSRSNPNRIYNAYTTVAFVGSVQDTSVASNIKNTLTNRIFPSYSNLQGADDPFNTNSFTAGDATFSVTFPLGTKKGYVVINFWENVGSQPVIGYTICIPVIVEGILNREVPILGTYTQPQMPFTVLHPPPGQGSFTQLNTSKTMCRSLENSFTSAQDISAKANVKIGAKFTVGFIVTTEVEVYAQLNFAAGGGFSKLETNSKETCLTTNNTFAASVQAGVSRDSSDRFVGFGYDVEYGVYDTIAVIGGVVKQYRGIVGVPLAPTSFSKTISEIRDNITSLTNLVNSPSSNIKQKADAENQIAVWLQVIAINENNKATASVPYPNALGGFAGGGSVAPFSSTESSQVSTTKSITAETYFSTTVGVEFALNIGGSGFGASSEFTSKFNWGSTSTVNQSTGNDLFYSLWDQDNSGPPYDQFNFQTFRDPMYGTPVFKLNEQTSRTSCPWEGGYKRDQLGLKINGQTENNKTVNVISTSTTASANFNIEIKNNSNEARTYTLGINNNSNLSGALIAASGFSLIGQTRDFSVPANGCLGCDPFNPLIVSIQRPNDNSPLSFTDRELVLFAGCESSNSESIFLTANFGVNPACAGSFDITVGAPTEPLGTCNGFQAVLSARGGTGAITYSVTPNVGSQAVLGTFTGLPAGTYVFTATDVNGCPARKSVTITLPVVNINPPTVQTTSVNVCNNASASLSATSGNLMRWFDASGTNVLAAGATFTTPNLTTNTAYKVRAESLGGCVSSFVDIAVNVNPRPTVPTITANGPTTFCGAGSVVLNANVGNNALNFVKTSSQYVNVPHSASINLGATFTMEAWVRYSGASSTIIDKGNYNFLWSLNANNNGNKMGFYTRNTAAWVYSTGTVPENTWTHVAITLNAGTLTFYINGVASGTATVAFSQDTEPMNIGRQQPTACVCNHFNGSMDELRLWNVVRTPSQIQTNMSKSVPNNNAGLVAYYKFDEGTGTTTADASGNGNNGTLVNSPTRQVPSTSPLSDVAWSPGGATTQSITVTTSGTYTATLTNGFGCTNSASMVVSINGTSCYVNLMAKIFLEGAFNTTTHVMNDNLRSSNIIPQTEPFTAMASTHFTHKGLGGNEMTTPSVLGITGNNAIVDWVFLELRDPSVSGTVLQTRSALLQADGDVVDMDGVSPVRFVGAAAGSYFIAIKHRNHMRMRTLNTVVLTNGINTFNFTNNSVPLLGTNPLRQVETSVYGLYTGDLNGDGVIDATDRSSVWNFRNLTGYSIYDCNMNGTVDATDRSNAWNNRNILSPF